MLKDCGTGELIMLSDTTTQVELVLGGGSGFGDPAERPVEAVAEDIADGYVSAMAAKRDYNVVITEPLVSA
jgi:5-oxoprolinase (ATP-hydrolysing)/N-methylhydantoinase A